MSILFATMLALLAGAALQAAPVTPLHGVDLSSLPSYEAHGASYRDADTTMDAMTLLARHGVDAVRLRLWHAPAGGDCDLAATLAMARRANRLGLTVLLDLHLSDTWADPGHQTLPAAWHGLDAGVLADSVRRYTREVVTAFGAAGAAPALVQIGNEIDAGMLWPAGRVSGPSETAARWDAFERLLAAGLDGVREAALPHPPRTVVHVTVARDPAVTLRFLDRLERDHVRFDVVGLSYYPWWHGPLASLGSTLDSIGARDLHDVMLVETAYPWTLEALDRANNIVGIPSQLTRGYEATPGGQAAFLRAVTARVAATPNRRGRGVFYWEPAEIPTRGWPSAWENMGLFDASGALLPSVEALTGRAP